MRKHSPHSQLSLFASNPREVFKEIRNYLAGRLVGATRDEALLQEVVKCLFCLMYANHYCPEVIGKLGATQVTDAYRELFVKLKDVLPGLFPIDDDICLDPTSLYFVHCALKRIDLNTTVYDPFGDVYEVFTGNGMRGQEGQFFTPQNAVHFLVEAVNPKPGERIIDPACGSGAFLSATARYLIQRGSTEQEAVSTIFGVDKDQYLVRLALARLSLLSFTPAQVYCGDSLALTNEQGGDLFLADALGTFDVVLANPPFGAKIVAATRSAQAQFELGYSWKKDKKTERYCRTNTLRSSVPPQVLFIERLLSLARPGGRVGLITPESLLSSNSYQHVIQYIQERTNIKAVVAMPEALFKTSGKGGTHTKTCLLILTKKGLDDQAPPSIFMAEAKWCGRDSRGRDISKDDLPAILGRYQQQEQGQTLEPSPFGYVVEQSKLTGDTLAPRYYTHDVDSSLEELSATHDLIQIGDLVKQGLLTISTGDEVGKLHYGTGTVPFVRTSDISNWEIKIDPKHCVSEDIYDALAVKQDVRAEDILMVRDGTYLIGKCALITHYDTQIVYQSHIYKIRSNNHEKLSPYLLLAALSCEPVIKQIKSRSYTQDIIDTLGNRIMEIVLPLPKDSQRRAYIIGMVKKAIEERIEARELARKACLDIVGV
jgi:type I restriction enzyme M protein